MYDKLPLDYIGITDVFGERIDPISNQKSYHYGVDLGWHKYQGEPIYATNNGKVVAEGYDSAQGNYVILTYDTAKNTIINKYLHMKARAIVKKGATVKRGQILGYMGSTGYSVGTHLHFSYWICPKGYKFKSSDQAKYAVNPLKYVYLFEDQTASTKSLAMLTKIVGKPVAKNTQVNQINVTGYQINCRNDASLKAQVLGYIDYGFYNVLATKVADGYTWYQIESKKWVAGIKNEVIYYEINKPDPIPDPDPNPTPGPGPELTCEEKVTQLETQIEEQKKIIEDLLSNDPDKTLNSFIAPKEDYYYIKLKKDEVVYYPKS